MAEQLQYRPADTRRAADDAARQLERLEGRLAEINALLDELYAAGVVRWLKDLAGAAPQAAEILADGMNTPQGRAGVRNLMVVAKQLGRIDPDRLERTLAAADAGLRAAAEPPPEDSVYNPPGLTGLVRLLHDRPLWQALAPVIDGVKAYSVARGGGEHEPGDG